MTAHRSRARRPDGPVVLVLRAPGTNCDRETAHAFERAGARALPLHVNALLAKPTTLDEVQGLVLPGGFSYGDDLGAGTVLGTRLRTRLRDGMHRLVERGGIVLGICNGFQILVKTGLLPGLADAPHERSVALASNLQNRYEDRWVTLEAPPGSNNVFFRPGDRIACPVAHAEGRFLTRDADVLARLDRAGQVALRYVAPDGKRARGHPENPNGAQDDVAGITDATGRVLGMMPHPERNQLPWHDPRGHRGEAPATPGGRIPFENAVRHLERVFARSARPR